MLTIAGRRDFLRVGALGMAGLSLPNLLRAAPSRPPARRCILLFLTGGPPQLDTWDMKPDAPAEVRGEFKPIATNVVGVRISELFPRLAQRADRLCIVRSVTHRDGTHTSAGYEMLTGMPHPDGNQPSVGPRPTALDHPHLGSMLALSRPGTDGVPPFVALPEVIKDANVNTVPGQDAGLLGPAFAPFRIEANTDRTAFQTPDIFPPPGVTPNRQADRQRLLGRLERRVSAVDPWYRKAFDVMRSEPVRRAFDLGRESPRLRDKYGSHLFGQGCLLARRLVEAGVGLTCVYWHYEGPDDSPVWDTHQNNFPHLRKRLMPPTDQAFAALLDDLADRGLLSDTVVACMGEFGRTPKVNKHGGRDHWAAAQSIALAGAGVRVGSVYGATDRHGSAPVDGAVRPADVTATLMHLLGMRPGMEITDRVGRPMVACHGKPIAGVLA